MELEWAKASEGWFSLDSVDVSDVNAYGVYVIWRGRRRVNPIVMYVGRGNIRREIELRRTDRLFCLANDLKVSWAAVDRPLRRICTAGCGRSGVAPCRSCFRNT
jgi:hypothetical protein